MADGLLSMLIFGGQGSPELIYCLILSGSMSPSVYIPVSLWVRSILPLEESFIGRRDRTIVSEAEKRGVAIWLRQAVRGRLGIRLVIFFK